MPVTVEIRDENFSAQETAQAIEKIFNYFESVDQRFSTYKEQSEISKINRGEINPQNYSPEMAEVLKLCEQTKQETFGYFDIKNPQGKIDPSGLVKGWAINNAAKLLYNLSFENFYIDAGGDIQVSVPKDSSEFWKVGIRNPFNRDEIVKVIWLKNEAIATSGTYIRGQHIYNPISNQNLPDQEISEVLSLSVIGSNIYDADRYATAAFAMGLKGIEFIEKLNGFEAYQIDKNGNALMTANFQKYKIS